jgi:hypothetical protein
VTFDDVRKIALAWPEVEDGTSYGTPALKVRKKLLARLKEDEEGGRVDRFISFPILASDHGPRPIPRGRLAQSRQRNHRRRIT